MTKHSFGFLFSILIFSSVLFFPDNSHAQANPLSISAPDDIYKGENHKTSFSSNTYYVNAPRRTNIQVVPMMEAPGEKSAGLAFLLEFFLGFGIGHYYAGNSDWATFGLASGLSMYGGVIFLVSSIESSGNNIALPITLIVLGAVGKLTSIIMAPIITSNKNREKRQKYYQSLSYPNNTNFFRYDESLPSLFGTNSRNSVSTPMGRYNQGASFLVPVLSLSF